MDVEELVTKFHNSTENFKVGNKVSKKIFEHIPIKSKGEKSFEPFDVLMDYIKQGKNVFVTGGGGVGKSYLLNKLKEKIPKLFITSTTGLSAVNVKGQTIHSWAGVGQCKKSIEEVVLKMSKKRRKLLRKVEIVAIDEISMLDNYSLDYISAVLKSVRLDSRPFGGIQVIMFGDFFQLPPVSLGDVSGNYRFDFCFNSGTWEELQLKTIVLNKVYRQSDNRLIEALNHIRYGQVEEDEIKLFWGRNNIKPSNKVVRLYPRNSQVNAYNEMMFNSIDSQIYTYTSTDSFVRYKKGQSIEIEIVKGLEMLPGEESLWYRFDEDCKAAYKIYLKEGCRVMLLSNLDVKKGLVNGSCGKVIHLTDRNVVVEFDNGEIRNVEKVIFEGYRDGQVVIKRKQYPLMLSYACSIHKAQGMTLDNAYIDFNGIFTYGQAYVALSRVKSLDGLYLENFNPNLIKADKKVIDFYNILGNYTQCYSK